MVSSFVAALLFAAQRRQAAGAPSACQPFPAGLTGTLVFQSDDRRGPDNPDGRNHIFTIDLASGAVTQLTSGRNHHDQHPRGRPTASASRSVDARGGNFDVYVMDADGTNVDARSPIIPANDYDPIWMPDGQSLIFSSERDSRSDLYRVWLERSPRRAADASLRRPRDHAERLARRQIRGVRRADPAAPEVLGVPDSRPRSRHRQDAARSMTAGGACWPSWSPDGKLIANVAARTRNRRRCRSATPTASSRARAAPRSEAVALLPGLVEGRQLDRALGQPRNITRAKTGTSRSSPADGSGHRSTDHRPRQRPPARLETVEVVTAPFCGLTDRDSRCRYNLCDAEPDARRSSCHIHPRRLQPDPGRLRRSTSSSRARATTRRSTPTAARSRSTRTAPPNRAARSI